MYPKVNQNITIDIMSQNQSGRSIVAEIKEKELLIGFPLSGNIMGVIPDGTLLEVSFFSAETLFMFRTEVIGSVIEKEIPFYRITKPDETEINKIQRRDNFRVNANLRLIINGKELITHNISAGGVLVYCPIELPLKEGDHVSGTLFIPNKLKKEEPISFQAIIRRVNLIENEKRKSFGLQFNKLVQRDQMKINQYCFEKQRQMRLKEREIR